MIKGNAREWTTTDYEKISDRELYHLLQESMPDKTVPEVTSYNRQTMIAFLKLFSKEEDNSI
jgi:hypothetical protein